MKKKLFFILAMTAMFSACSEVSYVQEEDHEIVAQSFVNVATKGPISGTTYPTDRTILLSAYHSGVGNYFTDIPFNYFAVSNVTAWHGGTSLVPNLKYWPHSGSMNFIALSKGDLTGTVSHDSNVASAVSYGMPDNSSAQVDVLAAYAGGRDCASHAAVGLNFKHAQAQIAVMASCDVYNTDTNHGISIRGIYLCNANYSGSLTASASGTDDVTLTWSSQGSTVNSKSFGASLTRLNGSSNCGTTGILVPGQSSSGTSIVIDYTLHNGKDNSGSNSDINLSYTYAIPSTTWTAGLIYTYAFTFTLNEITCSPSVTNWGAGSGASPSI